MKRMLKMAVAASLVFGTVAAMPVGGAGLVGVQTAKAETALPAEATAWLVKFQQMYDVHLSAADRAALDGVRAAMLADEAGGAALAAPLTDFLSANSAETFSNEEIAGLIWGLVDALSFEGVEEMAGNLDGLRLDPDVRATVAKLLAESGVELEGAGGLDVADTVAFLEAFRTAILGAINPLDALTYLTGTATGDALAELKEILKSSIQAAFTDVLEQDFLLSEALGAYADDDAGRAELAEAVARTLLLITDAYDADLGGMRALVKGMVLQEGVELDTTVSNNGRTRTPAVTVLGVTVPAALITWTVDSDVITFSDGAFRLATTASSNTDHTAAVKATVLGIVLWEGDITMRYTPPASPPAIVPTPTPAPLPVSVSPEERKEQVEQFQNSVQAAVEQLQNATPSARAGIIKEAVKQAQETLQRISTLMMADSVTTTNGKATVAMTEATVSHIVEQIQAIAQEAAAINEALKQLDPKASAKAVLTLDLGTVDADVEVPLVKEVLDAAAAAGIDLKIAVNGTAVVINPASLSEGTTITVSRVDSSAATSLTNNRVVSNVYDFTFTSGGNEINEFDRPVGLVLPVNTTAGTDTDMLTIAKVEDNGLHYYGGTYANGTMSVNRTSFSAYAVVENLVSFGDTTDVDAWAGRPIRSIAAKGVVEGRGEGQFDPAANVTRAEFAKMISKALGIDGGSATESFNDVTDADWFQPYVAAVQKWGITNGRGSQATFAPHENITRAEMATMIARALELVNGRQSYADVAETLKQFTDGDAIHATLQAGVAYSADQGIVVGMPGGAFAPDSFATRAEAAVMIYRLLNLD